MPASLADRGPVQHRPSGADPPRIRPTRASAERWMPGPWHPAGSVHFTDGTVIRDYFEDDAASRLRRRLERAGEADLEFQCTVIGLSFACERARGTTSGTPVNSFETAAPAAQSAAAQGTQPCWDRGAGAPLQNWSGAAERRLAVRVADRIRQRVYSRDGEFLETGIAPSVHLPGLMTGVGGLAYWLAATRAPSVPDVLTLET